MGGGSSTHILGDPLLAHGMPVHKATVVVDKLDNRSQMDPCGAVGDGKPKGRVMRTKVQRPNAGGLIEPSPK